MSIPTKATKVATRFVVVHATLLVGLLHGQNIFDSFSDNNNDLGWMVESRAANFGVNGSSIADFGFDYSEVGIPEAPNSPADSVPTSGLRLRTNLSGFSEDQIAASLVDPTITGDYRVEVDMWVNWAPDPNLIGTTLHAGPFVGQPTEDNPVLNLKPVEQGAGILVSSDGDCSNCDYILLKNEAELDLFSGQYSVGFFNSGDNRNQPGIDNTDISPGDFNGDGFIDTADFTVWSDGAQDQVDYEQWFANFGNEVLNLPESFPGFDLIDAVGDEAQPIEDPVTFDFYQQPVGAAGFQWVTVGIDVRPDTMGLGDNGVAGTATFTLTAANTGDTVLIGTVDNSVSDDPDDGFDTGEGPVSLEGKVSLVLIDFFSGGPADSELGFVLYDNFKLSPLDGTGGASVPEPSSGVMAVLSALLIAGRLRTARRR